MWNRRDNDCTILSVVLLLNKDYEEVAAYAERHGWLSSDGMNRANNLALVQHFAKRRGKIVLGNDRTPDEFTKDLKLNGRWLLFTPGHTMAYANHELMNIVNGSHNHPVKFAVKI